MAEVPELPKGITEPTNKGVEGLTNWKGLSEFVRAFPDPLSALIGVGIICASVVSLIIGTLWIICSTVIARQRTKSATDIELARLGVYRAERRRDWMDILMLAVLVLTLCAMILVALLLHSSQAKADYRSALHFTREFVDKAINKEIDPHRRVLLTLAATCIDDRRLACLLSKKAKQLVGQPSPEEGNWQMGPPEWSPMHDAMRSYLAALSYYDHRQGDRVRSLLSKRRAIEAMTDWVFDYPAIKAPRPFSH